MAIIAAVEVGRAIEVKLVSGDVSVADVGPIAGIISVFKRGPIRDSSPILAETLRIVEIASLAEVRSLSLAGHPAEIGAVGGGEIRAIKIHALRQSGLRN